MNKRVMDSWGLYAIVDPEHCAGRDPLWVARRALEGGAGILQLRDKAHEDEAALELAFGLKMLCDAAGVPFIVNDDARLARAAGADGVHLGQDDLGVAEARALLGPDCLIGLSTHTREQALAGQASGADYLGFGPMFATATKTQPYAPLGAEGARWAARTLTLPFVAIGGITAENLPALAEAGARNAAAIGAICAAPDPREAARGFAEVFEIYKGKQPD